MATTRKHSTNSGTLSPSAVNNSTHGMMRALEGGLMITRYSFRRRAEKRMFQVKLETSQLIWMRNLGSRPDGFREYLLITTCQIPRWWYLWHIEALVSNPDHSTGTEFRTYLTSHIIMAVATDTWAVSLDLGSKDTAVRLGMRGYSYFRVRVPYL